jgi:hypothetical protein
MTLLAMQKTDLTEILEIEKLAQEFNGALRTQILGWTGDEKTQFPFYCLTMGSKDPKAPSIGWVGGVHGLERIGSRVIIALLRSLLQMQVWDESVQKMLEKVRIFFIPAVNPWGMYHLRRSNPSGVDLMRNAPIDGVGEIPFLLGGHRYSAFLPWYRGLEFEKENQLLEQGIRDSIQQSPFSWTVDVHSGFGWQDQIWFPHAYTRQPIQDLPLVLQFKKYFEMSHPYHFYKFGPQSYQTHGDVWDFFYHKMNDKNQKYLPLTLELGSWNWIKKNPLQLFSREGLFHPFKAHRERRILRRHWTLFDFMLRMTASFEKWSHMSEDQFKQSNLEALELWYER